MYSEEELQYNGNSMFSFSRTHHAVSHSSCTVLHSHHQCASIPIFPHPHHYLLLLVWDISLCFFLFFKKHHFIAFYLLYLCTYFWLCRVFTAARGLSLVVASAVWVWGALCCVAGLLIAGVSPVAELRLRGTRAQRPKRRLCAGSVAAAPWRRCSMAGNLPGLGMEARSSALSGFLTTDPAGKSPHLVLVFIFLMISNLEQLSCTYWTFVYLVWQNTYSNSLPNFKSSLFLHCWVLGVLYTFWLWISYHIYDLQISSPIP